MLTFKREARIGAAIVKACFEYLHVTTLLGETSPENEGFWEKLGAIVEGQEVDGRDMWKFKLKKEYFDTYFRHELVSEDVRLSESRYPNSLKLRLPRELRGFHPVMFLPTTNKDSEKFEPVIAVGANSREMIHNDCMHNEGRLYFVYYISPNEKECEILAKRVPKETAIRIGLYFSCRYSVPCVTVKDLHTKVMNENSLVKNLRDEDYSVIKSSICEVPKFDAELTEMVKIMQDINGSSCESTEEF
jgi:hypothetical protein